MGNYTKLAVKSVVVVLVVTLIAGFLGYISRIILARNLAIEEFGLFYSVLSFLGLLWTFQSLGFDKATSRFIPQFLHKKQYSLIKSSIIYVNAIQLVTNTIIIISVYLFSDFLAANFFHNNGASIILRLMAISFFVDCFVLTLKSTFQGFRSMIYFSGIDAVRMALIVIIISVGIRLNYGILSPVYAYVITPLVLLAVFGSILVKRVFPQFAQAEFFVDKNLIKRISRYSIIILSSSVGGVALYYTDVLVLTYLTDLRNVALYSVALATAKVLMLLPRAIGGILVPLTVELWVKNKKNLLSAGIETLYKYNVILIIPIVFAIFSFTDFLINLFYGEQYSEAENALKILIIGMIFAVLYGININFFAGTYKPEITSKIIYAAAVFNLITNLIFIPRFGIIGAAITTTISYFIMMFMGFFYIRKFIKISFPIRTWAKTLLAGIIFTLSIWLLKKILFLNAWLEAFIVLAISGMIYIGLLFLLNIVSLKEIKDIYNRIAK